MWGAGGFMGAGDKGINELAVVKVGDGDLTSQRAAEERR